MREIIRTLCKYKGVEILEGHMMPDHVHLLSVQTAQNLYTGKTNAEIVYRLLESPRFAEVTYMIEQYFDDTLAAGFAGQNQMLTTLRAMLRRSVKTDAAVQAARAVSGQKVPCYQVDR